MYFFYMLRCQDNSLYCGITTNIEGRETKHNDGTGSTYVRSHGGGKIVYRETYSSKGDALRREIEVKKWPKAKKEQLLKMAVNK